MTGRVWRVFDTKEEAQRYCEARPEYFDKKFPRNPAEFVEGFRDCLILAYLPTPASPALNGLGCHYKTERGVNKLYMMNTFGMNGVYHRKFMERVNIFIRKQDWYKAKVAEWETHCER